MSSVVQLQSAFHHSKRYQSRQETCTGANRFQFPEWFRAGAAVATCTQRDVNGIAGWKPHLVVHVILSNVKQYLKQQSDPNRSRNIQSVQQWSTIKSSSRRTISSGRDRQRHRGVQWAPTSLHPGIIVTTDQQTDKTGTAQSNRITSPEVSPSRGSPFH